MPWPRLPFSASGSLREAFGHPPLRLFLLGNFLSNVGTWIQRITVGWLAYELTQSAAWVGIVAACEVVPAMLVAPYGGAIVDRSNRYRVFAIGQLAALSQALLLAACAFLGMLPIAVLVAASAALGIIDGFNQPSRLTIVSDIAPRAALRPAISLNSIGFNAARFIGPALGGIALVLRGPDLAFALNALSFIPFVILLVHLSKAQPRTLDPPPSKESSSILSGLRYTATHPVIATLFVLLITVSICARSVVELLPAIAAEWFDSSPDTFARLTSHVGLGAMLGGLWMFFLRDLTAVAAAVLALPGLLVATIVTFVFFGASGWWGYALLSIVGFGTVSIAVGMQSVIHLTVAQNFRGRVMSLYGLIQRAFAATGAMLIGFAADRTDLRVSILTAMALCLVVWIIILRRRRLLLSRIDPSD